MAPGCCIVTQSETGPFIDTGLTPPLVDPRVYVSRQAVIDMGVLFGFPRPDEHEATKRELDTALTHIEQLKGQLEEADRYADAAEYTLRATFGDDTKIKNKPGRKPKVTSVS
jgi:hypothetical protein